MRATVPVFVWGRAPIAAKTRWYAAIHTSLTLPFLLLLLATPARAGAPPIAVHLPYVVLQPGAPARVQLQLGLTNDERDAVTDIARAQDAAVRALAADLPPDAYNAQVLAAATKARDRVEQALGPAKSDALWAWVQTERARTQGTVGAQSTGGTLTYTVFATWFNIEAGSPPMQVALPDKCLKFANYGWSDAACHGYDGKPYNVRIEDARTGKSIAAVGVWDAGPHNIDDNYWDAAGSGAHPRRLFADLPRGLPEAQAAVSYGYNDGKDQYGRLVTNPAGIDLSPAAIQALGLCSAPGTCDNDWVKVTFLWSLPRLWPGDADDDCTVDERDALNVIAYEGASGPPRPNASTAWTPQDVDTSGWANGDAAFADANGDGLVDAADLDVVQSNWGRSCA